MLTAQGFCDMLVRTYDRMQATEQGNARTLISQGQPYQLARYYAGGPVVTVVEVPESWRVGEVWRDVRTVSAVLPEHQ